jgi:glutamate N-acetyltransferase/amino-acid N-acetyltransferase
MLGNPMITEKSSSYGAFKNSLSGVAYELSELVAEDGEGATKFIEITVKGARSEADAEKAGFAVANSNLVKTAMYGNDANWGRIMAALGYSGINFKEEKVDVYFNNLKVVKGGMTTGKDKQAGDVLKGKHIRVFIDLNAGKASVKVLTCDLTEEYIRVNAEYRT